MSTENHTHTHTVAIYGIKSCDTMKKAFTWLEQHGIAYTFHDYKKEGLDEALAKRWVDALPLDKLINRRGTTWRKLEDSVKESLSAETAPALMVEQPSLIKRPLLDTGAELHLGFKDSEYEALLSK